MRKNKMRSAPLLYAVAIFTAAAANAQNSSVALDEITVTAERRATSLQNTPAAITAITGDAIEAVRVNHLNELTLTTPGVNIQGINRNQQYISMRGNITETGDAGAAQSIGFFIDGLYFGRSSLFNQSLSDVERVEILKGPQGTLWGHNIVGGSINVITKDPTQETEADLKIAIGNFNRVELAGRVAGGLTDKLAGQFTFSSETSDGYVTNLDSGQELGDEDVQLFRGKLVWDITDKLTAKATATFQKDTSGMNARNYLPGPDAIITPPPPGTTAPVLLTFAIPDNFEEETFMGTAIGGNDIETTVFSLNLDYDFDNGMRFSSLTGLIDSGGLVDNFSFFPIPASHGLISRDTDYDDSSFSQEFHLSGGDGGALFWQVGAYYYDATNEQFQQNRAFAPPFTRAGGQNAADARGNNNGLTENDTLQSATTESFALFGQATWAVNDWLSLTFGARYTDVDKSVRSLLSGESHTRIFTDQATDCNVTPPITCAFDRTESDSWSNTSPRFIIDGQWEDLGAFDSFMVYATYAEGWKEGGFQVPSSSTADSQLFAIAPESADNIEVGFKSTFWDNRATFNATLFNTEYSGQQTVVFVGTELRVFNLDSEIDGLEIDGNLAVTDWLTLNYSAAFYDAEYAPGATLGPNPGDSVAGNDTVGTPDTSYTVGWDAGTVLNNGWEVFFTGSYAFSSELESDPDEPLQAADAVGRGLHRFTESKMLSASLGMRHENWEISLWGRNLLDDYVITNGASFTDFWVLNAWNADQAAIEVFEGTRTEPRTFGVSVGWRFE